MNEVDLEYITGRTKRRNSKASGVTSPTRSARGECGRLLRRSHVIS